MHSVACLVQVFDRGIIIEEHFSRSSIEVENRSVDSSHSKIITLIRCNNGFRYKMPRQFEVRWWPRCSLLDDGRIFWETFYCQLAICLTTFLKNHREDICETSDGDSKGMMLFALEFLVRGGSCLFESRIIVVWVMTGVLFQVKMASRINHEETFKILVDYWHHLSEVGCWTCIFIVDYS